MIKIFLSNDLNNSFFVWDAEDVYKLRKYHRIVGALIGVHPYMPGQVKRRHVPLKLMKEEVKLLLDKNLAQLHQTPNQPLDETLIETINEKRDKLSNEQIILSKEHRKQEILMKCNDPEIAKKKSEEVQEITKDDAYFQIFTECPWKKEKAIKMPSKYPSTPLEGVRYAVFKDLWENNFYITTGSKFGGDYLVYAGDPHICHSLFIVVCMLSSQKLQGFDIVVYGRLGNQVKKTVVLASLNKDGCVQYISLEYVQDSSKLAIAT